MRPLKRFIPLLFGAFTFFAPAQEGPAARPVALRVDGLGKTFQFVSFGDTRFTEIGGDIAYKGTVPQDWEVFDRETALWRTRGIPVFPALGNHELMGKKKSQEDKSKNPQDEIDGLANDFARFPDLKQSRYYSMRAGNLLFLLP